jgi:aspartyl protease family protein
LLRERLAELLKALLFWVVLVAALAAAYTHRGELQVTGERMLAELVPGRPVQVGHTVLIARGHGGDFTISARVNDAPVAMVLDTGASSIVLTQEAARAAGLPLDMLGYTVDIDTANGHSRAAAVALDRVAVGSIVEHAVPALVAPPGRLKQSLLGMSFLNRLESYEMRGDKLLMHASP